MLRVRPLGGQPGLSVGCADMLCMLLHSVCSYGAVMCSVVVTRAFSSAELSWNLRRANDLKRHRAHLVSVSLLDLGLGFDLFTAVVSWMQYLLTLHRCRGLLGAKAPVRPCKCPAAGRLKASSFLPTVLTGIF